jgi:hypothetical protein
MAVNWGPSHQTGGGDWSLVKVGVYLLDGLGVRLPLLVLGARPIDAREGGVLALALARACGDPEVGADLLDGLAVRASVAARCAACRR